MTATRWGIASAGRISQDFCNALRMLPKDEHDITVVAARSLDRAQDFAKTFDIPDSLGSYDDLAGRKDIDVVYIGTVHIKHVELSKMMLNSGKNVLCEKPMAMNDKDAKEVLELAKEKGLFYLEGFWSRFFPVYKKLDEMIMKESIGEILQVTVNFGFDIFEKERVHNKELGGGAMLDIGCYGVQFALFIFKEYPQRIEANGILVDGIDTMVSATLYFSKNRTAQLNFNVNVRLNQEAVVHGKKGIIRVPEFWCPFRLATKLNPLTDEEFIDFPLPELNPAIQPMLHHHSEGFVYEAMAVRDCLLKGLKEHPFMTWQNSSDINKVITEIRKKIGILYSTDK